MSAFAKAGVESWWHEVLQGLRACRRRRCPPFVIDAISLSASGDQMVVGAGVFLARRGVASATDCVAFAARKSLAMVP